MINDCYGGFGISNLAIHEYRRRKGLETYFYDQDFSGGNLVYKKVNKEYDGLFVQPSLTDFGEKTEKIEWLDCDYERNDPDLVALVEELGEKANSRYSRIKIVEIPDDVEWTIEEYDGNEWVAEKHRIWS